MPQKKLGKLLFESGDYAAAFGQLLKEAEAGDAESAHCLSKCYEYGYGTARDLETAQFWEDFAKQAEADGRSKQKNDAESFYLKGAGVTGDGEKSDRERVKWFKKAAALGNADAQCALGICLESGRGVERDIKAAVKLYQKAAAVWHAEARYRLGLCYEAGNGIEQDVKKAAECYRGAAQNGCAGAQSRLGYCYENGIGVEKNVKTAVELYKKAAAQSDAEGLYRLGCCHLNKTVFCYSDAQGAKLLEQAAGFGHVEALFASGCCYESGRGVVKDIGKALLLYKKAAEMGSEGAKQALERLG